MNDADTLENPQELPFPDHASELLAMPGVLSAVILSTDTPTGWCPFAIRQSTPNFWKGNSGRKAVVDHITAAAWASVVSWFKNPASERSAHFQVRKDGTIDQFVSVDDSAWANGASWVGGHWVDPQGHIISPSWVVMQTDHTNPNRLTVSIEHEGMPNEEWTAPQKAADTKLKKWLAKQFGTLNPYIAHQTLIGHYHISPIAKPNCPGPHVDLNERAAAANQPPPPPDPLRTHTLPSPLGSTHYCSDRIYALYVARGGMQTFGLALSDEHPVVGQDGRACTIVLCERAVLKSATPEGAHLALLSEAYAKGWLP